MPKIEIAGNVSDEFKAKLAAKVAEGIIKIMKGEVKPQPHASGRADDNASYRAAMIDAGRGRLLK